ncbi:MAG: hypothetical protein IJC11_00745 [Alphaproteobacteria bacterium]|nr:hypothetical protein [Alphaproteobacteria bacterium]MBQ6855315.1 hypothetical protein [Alphaproteobacteria bacterium]MBQ8557597.1 hypothetical protein [Alphaproteobacteria bacterium]MBR3913138.1 hypothetical protein [Alphaproteobacteria bacterium]
MIINLVRLIEVLSAKRSRLYKIGVISYSFKLSREGAERLVDKYGTNTVFRPEQPD